MQVQYLKGVGEKMAARLAKLGITDTQDLLGYYPRGYIDYSAPYPVVSAPYETKCVVRTTVDEKGATRRLPGGRQMLKVLTSDESGYCTLTYFNNPYAPLKLQQGETYLFYGKVAGSMTNREMINPEMLTTMQAAATPLVAVYPLTEGVSSNFIAKCVKNAFVLHEHDIQETLPAYLVEKYRLGSRADALRKIHFPHNMQEVEEARRRLIFEELLALQLGLLLLRGRESALTGARMRAMDISDFWESLPFNPTGAQVRCVQEIIEDFTKPTAMNRLLQGDVGSGKTLVAAAAMVMAAKNGYQSVLMAPTEILAAQHAETLQKMLAPLGLTVALLTGSVKGKSKKALLDAIASHGADIVVGTHAVISEGVTFAKLGFAVTDEQHRFGVRQRSLLAQKADHPHLLVMSATPIPRTLALLMFGDLEISVIDEMPPGRTPIKTYAITGKKRADMYGFIAKQLAAGRQAYIVCPMINEDEEGGGLLAVSTYKDEVAQPLLPQARIGVMHGKLKPAQKAEVMRAFAAHELDVLVSTTVIEVGVDVPNATVMVIENAERFGLSALHQLRGRVGRGAAESTCIFISDHASEAVRDRLRFLCSTTDGFAIAKYDLENRGPGDFFGSRQHGLPTLQLADLMGDTRTLKAAQQEALAIVHADARLDAPENAPLADAVQRLFGKEVAMN